MINSRYSIILLALLLIACAFPQISAPVALLLGVLYAVIFGNPVVKTTQKATHILLQLSVIGLGFGMNTAIALDADIDHLPLELFFG